MNFGEFIEFLMQLCFNHLKEVQAKEELSSPTLPA